MERGMQSIRMSAILGNQSMSGPFYNGRAAYAPSRTAGPPAELSKMVTAGNANPRQSRRQKSDQSDSGLRRPRNASVQVRLVVPPGCGPARAASLMEPYVRPRPGYVTPHARIDRMNVA